MANSYKLLETNSNLEIRDTVYQSSDDFVRDTELDTALQVAIREIFEESKDKSLFSLDIEQRAQTKDLWAELSTLQHNYLRALDLSRVNTALDLTQDTGGVTHYLADQVKSLDSVKIDVNRSRLAVQRCASKSNVLHVSSDLDAITLPQTYYDLIVLGDLENCAIETKSLQEFLVSLRKSLSPSGVLLLNSPNQERLNRWFDGKSACPDESVEFADLYTNKASERALSRKDLRDTLSISGFDKIDLHANFSSDSSCKALFSEDYLSANPNCLNHFHRLGFIENVNINEYLLFTHLVKEKHDLNQFASRYIAIAGASLGIIRQLYDSDFSHFAGTSRRPAWRTITSRKRASLQVEKFAAFPDSKENSDLISQNLAPQAFHKGRLLVHDWLIAVLDLNDTSFKQYVSEYRDYLNHCQNQGDFNDFGFDLLPFNIVVKLKGDKRELHAIDPEWSFKSDLSVDFVLFRALFWFALENKSVIKAYCQKFDFYSIGAFIIEHMPSAHSLNDLADYVEFIEKKELIIYKQAIIGI